MDPDVPAPHCGGRSSILLPTSDDCLFYGRARSCGAGRCKGNGVITYKDRVTNVNLGDRVTSRIWFRQHAGRVVYVPGVSAFNATMEFNGLRWVGVRLEEGGFMSLVVDPREEYLRGRVTFVGRDPEAIPELKPGEDPHRGDSFGAPF
jgi:hypothetical protein